MTLKQKDEILHKTASLLKIQAEYLTMIANHCDGSNIESIILNLENLARDLKIYFK